jgi:acyl-CoA synthetase (AMP-forming)/AMP-acid ligase II
VTAPDVAAAGDPLTESLFGADTSRPVLDISVGALLRQAAAEVPERPVLVSIAADRDPRTWTYAQLLADAEHAAAWLLQRFRPGDHIAVWAPNLPEWVVLQYGAALAGLVLVTANPALRGAELTYLLRQSRSAGVAYAESFRGTDMAALIEQVLAELPEPLVAVPFTGWLEQIRAVPVAGMQLPAVDPKSATQIQFTSGTTGFPKAAVLRHSAMVTNADYIRARGNSPEHATWVSAMPLFHTAGCGMAGMGTLVQRGTLVLAETFDPGLMLQAVEQFRAEVLVGVPAMLKALLAHAELDSFEFTSLQVVMSGGDTVPPELVEACERTFGVGFSTVYGQTELSPIVTQTSPEDTTEDNRHTAGRPLWNVEVTILDPSSGQVVPVGSEGEICARGYQRMIEYLDMPEETAATIDADGWLHTGDLGAMDGRGYVTVTGRLKDMIIRGGENIYPREIEDALREHPAIADAVVLGLQDPDWGETVAAIVQLQPDTVPPAITELRRYLRARLAPHKTPRSWYISGSLPTNAMGKLQKFRLREQIQADELQTLDG